MIKNELPFTVRCIFSFIICFLIVFPVTSVSAEGEMDNLKGKIVDFIGENEDKSAGMTTIIINDDEIINQMTGYADIENEIIVDENTVFEWGSISKVLIWISVFQLLEAGKLDLETDITTYLPNDFLPKTTFDEKVTLQHLMNHTAGFEDSYTDLMVYEPTSNSSLRTVLEEANIMQVFPPGRVVAYSNYGASLAAYIVSEVSGLDYRDYVKKHIFDPLDMKKTAIDATQNDNEWVKKQRKLIQGYTKDLALIEPNHFVIPMYPSGSVTGTATDLQKLLQALLSEDGVPLFQQQQTIEQFFQASLYFPETEIPRVANGLFFLPSHHELVFGHGGNTIAFSSSLYVDRKDKLGVLVLTNMANESTYTFGIPELVFGKYEPTENKSKLENSAKWIGIYEPARAPYNGFSKVYRLFLRSEAKQVDSHNIMMNDLYYRQMEPGIYMTEDDYSMYGLDIYSAHPQYNKVLSASNSDLLYVPYYKHYFEWISIILFALALLYSFSIVITSIIRKIRRKQQSKLIIGQHSLNVFVFFNIMWISYKTLSMTTYTSLKPFLIVSVLYVFISIGFSGYFLLRMKNKKEKSLTKWLTVLSTVVLCVNIIYWEFYI